jgi:3-oxoacyl-[acyl-carrier-protein] synthase II
MHYGLQMEAFVPRRRVVITGVGAVTPVGNTAPSTWDALTAGRSGISRITHFDASGCAAQIAGEVRDFDPRTPIAAAVHPRGPGGGPVISAVTQKDFKKFGRFTHLGLAAGLEAYVDSGLDAFRAVLSPLRMGANLGVGLGGLPEIVAMHETWRQGGFRKISPFFILQTAPNILAGQLAIMLDLRGPNMCVASACATSGHALGESFRAIQRGDADVIFAGGAEAVVSAAGRGGLCADARPFHPQRPAGEGVPAL